MTKLYSVLSQRVSYRSWMNSNYSTNSLQSLNYSDYLRHYFFRINWFRLSLSMHSIESILSLRVLPEPWSSIIDSTIDLLSIPGLSLHKLNLYHHVYKRFHFLNVSWTVGGLDSESIIAIANAVVQKACEPFNIVNAIRGVETNDACCAHDE